MRRRTLEHRALLRNLPIGAGATALLLSACSFAPQYKLPDVPTDAQYHASVDANADTGWTPATPQDRLSRGHWWRSEEHTSELQSLMRSSYAVFCLKKKTFIY